MSGRSPLGSGLRPFGVEPPAASQAEPLVPNAIRRWTNEECRLLLAMRRERIERKKIARILGRSPKSIKTRLELLQ